MKKHFKTLAVYFALFLLPWLARLWPSACLHVAQAPSLKALVAWFPYFGYLFIGLLGWKLNQTRITFTALILAGTYALFSFPDALKEFMDLPAQGVSQIFALGLPLSFGLVFYTRESRLASPQTLTRAGLGLVPLLLLAAFYSFARPDFNALAKFGFLYGYLKLPLLALASLLALGLIANYLVDHRVALFLNTLLLAFASLLFAFQSVAPGSAYNFRQALDKKAMEQAADFPLEFQPGKKVELRTQAEPDAAQVPLQIAFCVVAAVLLHVIFLMYWHRVYMDELTGIPNRRALDERLAGITGEYALAMIDIDHFKKFNDEYGHDEGDNVLRLVAQRLETDLGPRAYRYGGEEFCAVFEKLGAEDAYPLANRARRNLAERPFAIRKTGRRKNDKLALKPLSAANSRKVQVTISVGLAAPNGRGASPTQVLKSADQALYKAKENGRNCVMVSKG